MWLILGATDTKEGIRIAQFSTRLLAEEYLEKSKCKEPGFIFSSNSLLRDCCWAKVIFEKEIPINPEI